MPQRLLMFNHWQKVWELQLPPKLRFFVWKLCSGTLPVKDALIARGMVLSPECAVCGHEIESLLHLFIECKFTKDMWCLFPVLCPEMAPFSVMDDVYLWLDYMLNRISPERLRFFFIVSWWLWKNRNKCVFDGSCFWPLSLCTEINRWVGQHGDQGIDVILSGEIAAAVSNVAPKWSVPDKGCIKINFDAAFYKESLMGYYGIIARDERGEVLAARGGSLGLVESAIHAESLAAGKAVQMASFFHKYQCGIEGDCLELILNLNDHVTCFSDTGAIVEDLKADVTKLVFKPSFIHVKRAANMAAHVLAHFHYLFECFHCNDLPLCVKDVVQKDKLSIQ